MLSHLNSALPVIRKLRVKLVVAITSEIGLYAYPMAPRLLASGPQCTASTTSPSVDQRSFCSPENLLNRDLCFESAHTTCERRERRLRKVNQETPALKAVAKGTVARLAFEGFVER